MKDIICVMKKISMLLVLGSLLAAYGCERDPAGDSLRYVQQAKDYSEKGEHNAAVIELKNALRASPDNVEARLLLGNTYLTLNKGPDAEKELRQAIELGMPEGQVIESLARSLLLQKKYEEAVGVIVIPVDLPEQDRARLHALRGEAYIGNREPGKAETDFSAALAIVPASIEGATGMARLAFVRYRFDESRELVDGVLENAPDHAPAWQLKGDLESLAGNLEQAEQSYGTALEANPYDLDTLTKRALIRAQLKDFDGASRDIQALREGGQLVPYISYVQGVLEFRQQRFKQAQLSFEKTLSVVDGYVPAMYFLGAAHFELGNAEQAAYQLQRVISKHPDHMSARKILAAQYIQVGRYTDAEKILMPVLQRNPNDPVALRIASELYMARGDRKQGLSYLEDAVALQPDLAESKLRLGLGLISIGEEVRGLELLNDVVAGPADSKRAGEALVLGLILAGNYDQALQALEKARSEQGDTPSILNLKGLTLSRAGDEAGARTAYRNALEIEPGEPAASLNLVALEMKAGDYDAARKLCKSVIEHHPDHLQAYLHLAEIESREGHVGAVRDWLEKSVANIPKALKPRLHLAKFYLVNGQPERSLELLDAVEPEYSDHPLWLIAYGEAQMALGEAENAEVSFRKVVDSYPSVADGHYFLAMAYNMQQDTKGMRAALDTALKINPEHQKARIAMAGLLLAENNTQQAEPLLNELHQSYPDDTNILTLQGLLAMQQKRHSEAAELFAEVMKRNPGRQAVLDLANAQLQSGDPDASVATLRDWLAGNPDDTRVQASLANVLLILKRTDEAKAVLSGLTGKLPDNPLVLNSLAWLLRDDDPEKALEYAEKSYQLAPGLPPVMDTLGVILMQQGDAKRAVRLLQEASGKAPDSAAISYHYAQALAETGSRAEARSVLQQLLSADKNFPEKEQARELLGKLGG